MSTNADLPHLDPDVEREERRNDRVAGKPDLAERARETEAVQQAEARRHELGTPRPDDARGSTPCDASASRAAMTMLIATSASAGADDTRSTPSDAAASV